MGETTGSRQLTYLVRQAALELASHNITVNAIAPGAFATNIGGGRLKLPEVNQGDEPRIPLGRVASPEEIKGLALFLGRAGFGLHYRRARFPSMVARRSEIDAVR